MCCLWTCNEIEGSYDKNHYHHSTEQYLRTRNNTDGNKLVIFSGITLYYGDTYSIYLKNWYSKESVSTEDRTWVSQSLIYRNLARLTAFILAVEKVGESICLCRLHASPLACTIPTGVLCSEATKLGSCCSKEELHSYQFQPISHCCMMPVESFEELSRGEQSSSGVIDYTCKHAVIWLTTSRKTGRRISVYLWVAHKVSTL